ncbi:hypothetical protein H6P81_009202 [Aristolochia fimbriata]|uniref:Rab-GAP TBC domain-containing protein n=1 Tax=Aristolochia fimbriata TaxID=158543 RepID=A0AAV7ENB5_ARIFI|nr:hypothetical protein H6P81_009202 [Aristolochia fimbriata]
MDWRKSKHEANKRVEKQTFQGCVLIGSGFVALALLFLSSVSCLSLVLSLNHARLDRDVEAERQAEAKTKASQQPKWPPNSLLPRRNMESGVCINEEDSSSPLRVKESLTAAAVQGLVWAVMRSKTLKHPGLFEWRQNRMCTAPAEPSFPQPLSSASEDMITQSSSTCHRFDRLRSVQWRINLGILPSSTDSSVEELRRVAADSRRRYAGLRRRLLVDPHFLKEDSKASDPIMDNPLSQNPDSMWGRFFRNAELEKMVDQDLSRLYPERESYFQTMTCQAILRRILLLWCLRHPEFGYRQGMHELLAPLLYVLHIDVQRLSEVREQYEDFFSDKFDGMSETDLHYSRASSPVWASRNDYEDDFQEGGVKPGCSLNELDTHIQTIVMLNDAYGAEGELGILLSERFMEHDAYCMFDALMNGACGVVAMADYFSPSPASGSITGLPPVIEASSALYHLLSVVDSSLHCHLVELGVEPQYFSLRWLRVLFGREFSLEDLLIIWDEIFASANNKLDVECEDALQFIVLTSPRGAFIIALAVSMLLHLRSSLLATENATTCLQRLLSFPENVNLKKLIDKAKSLQALALEANTCSSPSPGLSGAVKPTFARVYGLSSGSVSPRTPLNSLPESYWEKKWRVLHNKENLSNGSPKDQFLYGGKKGSSGKERSSLARAESAPSSIKTQKGNKISRFSVRRRLLEDLSRELGEPEPEDDKSINEISIEKGFLDSQSVHMANEENSSIFSDSTSPSTGAQDHDNDSEKSSVTSNSGMYDNEDEISNAGACSGTMSDSAESSFRGETKNNDDCDKNEHSDTRTIEDITDHIEHDPDGNKQVPNMKERKPLSGKFQWLWRFSRNNGEGTSEKGANMESQRSENSTLTVTGEVDGGCSNSGAVRDTSSNVEAQNDMCADASKLDGCNSCRGLNGVVDTSEKNVIGSLKNLGQSMLENIQVIESVFQQERGHVGSLENLSRNILSGKGQVTAMAALKELRKISNLLSEIPFCT